MNFVKLKEPTVEWFASKNDMSLKQHCLQLQLKQCSVVTVMIVILKYGSGGQLLRRFWVYWAMNREPEVCDCHTQCPLVCCKESSVIY